MSVFALAKNNEEVKLHMEQYIEYANALNSFYKDFDFRYKRSSWEEGWIEFSHIAVEYDINRYGTVHGGVIMMLADTASGITAFETGTGNSAPTMNMEINFLKPIREGDEMVFRTQVLSSAKRTCTLRVDVLVNGELAATATNIHRKYTDSVPETPASLSR